MRAVSLRRLGGFVLSLALLGTVRAVPLEVARLNGGTYFSVIDIASHLGMRLGWASKGKVLSLSDRVHHVELTADNHEAMVDGVRVYLGAAVLDRGGTFYLSATDFDRRLGPILRPVLAGPVLRHPLVVVIDPGHGGSDAGTQNFRLGLKEKTLTLDVALRLKQLLEAGGYRAILTRTSDTYVDLPARPLIALQTNADLFVSIHFNSVASDSRVHGAEIFTFPPAGQRSSDSWGRKQDDRMNETVPGNRQDGWNSVLAHAVLRSVAGSLKTDDLGEKIAHFAVLRGLPCPGVLVEPACLSNEGEALRVATPAFREEIAQALFSGIRSYVAELDALRPLPKPAAPPHA